ncbi:MULTISPECIES: hypothetical protein [Methylosinus]|uniref:Uncharacterized protein n=1 Tax=Methylosinus trichosporium (strain ATCC 35070 / NCIMB 11131 / UNIQEM 75 / OB3b) TaxID=595536 RepID=A0A2D2CXR9_METT3|nr:MULTISPECIES: hypothetical protein [Methylosinus]ATQ67513.1 hypothetical protein CQW49_06115 [Methylosinus trichosporium OB3b]OBS51450.1 hypothetical protein A8B73_16140 [Methylosinus sp. 3S-1]
MLTLLKCVIFLGIVLIAIAAREGGRDERPARLAAARPSTRAGAPAETTVMIGAARAALSDVADQAVGRAAEAAREHCLAHPLDCLRAAEKLQSIKAESGRR